MRGWLLSLAGKLVLASVTLIVGLALMEGGARLVMPQWRDADSSRFMARVGLPDGRTANGGRAGFDGYFAQNNGDFRVHIRLDDKGFRNDQAPQAEAIWIAGDSFAFGWGVERQDTFGAVIGDALRRPVYSIASSGTDVCGYRLMLDRANDGAKAAAVVLGLTLENDLGDYSFCNDAVVTAEQTAQTFTVPTELGGVKGTLTQFSALYNLVAAIVKRSPLLVSILQEARLIARENSVGVHVGGHSAAELDSTIGQVLAFHRSLPPGTPFVVLLIPARFEYLSDGEPWRQDRQGILDRLRRAGITVVDPYQYLVQSGLAKVHFSHDGHWSPLGHRIAGEAVAAVLAPLLLERKEP